MGKQRKSRKGKKAWRKNIDVTGLEDQIIAAAKPDAQLFIEDKRPIEPELSKQQRKQKIRAKVLHTDSVSIPQPIGTSKPASTNTPQHSYFHQLVAKHKHPSQPPTQKKKKHEEEIFDLWSTPVPTTPRKEEPEMRGVTKVLQSKLTSAIPGQSYNPTKGDHQKLLKSALDELTKVQEKREQEEKAASVLLAKYRLPSEMEVKIHYDSSDDEDEEVQKPQPSTTDEIEKKLQELAKNYSTRLTRTHRNKLAKRKRNEFVAKRRAAMLGAREKKFAQLPSLLESVEEYQKEMESRQEQRDRHMEVKENSTRRFGKHRFEQKHVDFLYTDEIPNHLRQLKAKNDFAMDIFNNFQRRNLIEPRKPIAKQATRTKFREKRSAKSFAL